MFSEVTDTIHEWYSQPFTSTMDAKRWILFMGLIIIAAFLWNVGILWLFKKVE